MTVRIRLVLLLFPTRNRGFLNSRRVAGIRTDASGRYIVRNLPPGDYFIVGTDDIEAGAWHDPRSCAT